MNSENWSIANPLKRLTALAAVAGWTKINVYKDDQGPDLLCGTPPDWVEPEFGRKRGEDCEIPDYMDDTDLMRELEKKVLKDEKIPQYIMCLLQIVLRDTGQKTQVWIRQVDDAFLLVTATAKQRAEALVIIMENNEDDKR